MSENNPDINELMGGAKPSAKPAAKKAETEPARPASILTDEEIEAAKKIARENVEKAMRDAELKKVVAAEEERIKRIEGQRTGKADKDEEVSILIDLAEFCDRITINFQDYYHGRTYQVPRHVADSLREIMQRTYRHQMELDGKSLEETYRRAAPVALSPTGQRPLQEGVL